VEKLHQFKAYARTLACRFPFRGSGGDAQDVEQEAMIAAWHALRIYKPGVCDLQAFVRRRMRLRVIDYVLMRHEGGQLRAEREVSPLDDCDVADRDVTLSQVLARETLSELGAEMRRLQPRQRLAIVAALNGWHPREVDPMAKPDTFYSHATHARRRLASILAIDHLS
jgi:DNA-directed RNA polymerase specialized sigma24 family protein